MTLKEGIKIDSSEYPERYYIIGNYEYPGRYHIKDVQSGRREDAILWEAVAGVRSISQHTSDKKLGFFTIKGGISEEEDDFMKILTRKYPKLFVKRIESLSEKRIVMEYAEYGNCQVFMETVANSCSEAPDIRKKIEVFNLWLPEHKVANSILTILEGIQTLHDKEGLVHRDISLENIFSFDIDKQKLGGFGNICKYSDVQSKPMTPNDRYAPPEYHKHKRYDGKQYDMWSVGIIIYILLSGSHPFEGKSMGATIENIKACALNIEPIREKRADVSKHAMILIQRTLTPESQLRLTASAAVNMAKKWRDEQYTLFVEKAKKKTDKKEKTQSSTHAQRRK